MPSRAPSTTTPRALPSRRPPRRARTRALEDLAVAGDATATVATAVQLLQTEQDQVVLETVFDVLSGHLHVAPIEPVVRLATGNASPSIRIRALELLGSRAHQEPHLW